MEPWWTSAEHGPNRAPDEVEVDSPFNVLSRMCVSVSTDVVEGAIMYSVEAESSISVMSEAEETYPELDEEVPAEGDPFICDSTESLDPYSVDHSSST